jgi:hypothetical protein
VRAIKFTRGADRVTAVLAKAGKQWVLTGGWAAEKPEASLVGILAMQLGLLRPDAWQAMMRA